MKIGFNAILMQIKNTGVENYITHILNEFNQTAGNEFEISAYLKKQFVDFQEYKWSNLKLNYVPCINNKLFRIIWEHFYLPLSIEKQKYDLIHSPGYIVPLLTKKPVIVTIHDTITLDFTDLCRATNALYYKKFLPYSIYKSHKIIVPSLYVKKQILKRFNISTDKIVVIYEGVNKIFSNMSSSNFELQIKKKYRLPDCYLLFVGTIEPKKNIEIILAVFERLLEKHQNLNAVIVGKIGWKSKSVLNKLRLLEYQKKAVYTGYVSAEELAAIYRMSLLFMFPSLIEGFGVPPLEAMASGTPVITSDRGAIPEIVDSAAIKINPLNFQEIYSAAEKIISSIDLRQELIEKGFERVKQFSWRRAALETLDIYKSVGAA